MGVQPVRSYRDLAAWQNARELSYEIYQMTQSFPQDERFGLISQIRRCAISVPSNIAEGYGRGSQADYVRFLRIARGSLFELETQLTLSSDLGFVDNQTSDNIQEKINTVARPLSGLIRSMESV